MHANLQLPVWHIVQIQIFDIIHTSSIKHYSCFFFNNY